MSAVVVETVRNGVRVWVDAPSTLLFTMRRYPGESCWWVHDPWNYYPAVVDDFGCLVRVER